MTFGIFLKSNKKFREMTYLSWINCVLLHIPGRNYPARLRAKFELNWGFIKSHIFDMKSTFKYIFFRR